MLDVPRPRREVINAPAPTGPREPACALVDTAAAAEALGVPAPTLFRFADARIVTPARVDPDGSRWWNLHEMRHQIAAYLDDQGEGTN